MALVFVYSTILERGVGLIVVGKVDSYFRLKIVPKKKKQISFTPIQRHYSLDEPIVLPRRIIPLNTIIKPGNGHVSSFFRICASVIPSHVASVLQPCEFLCASSWCELFIWSNSEWQAWECYWRRCGAVIELTSIIYIYYYVSRLLLRPFAWKLTHITTLG